MALDPEVLLNYPIPEVRQRYSRRDSAFYALTLGLGGDPLDERQLVYVDPCHDLQALPCMALVLGHPGFWLGNPATGVDALRLVHGEQRLEWRRPLPAEGEVIGRTRVTGLVDKGADKGALLYSEKVLSDALSGEVLAVARSTTFLRGDGGFGGSRQVPEMPHRLPERTPDLRLDLPTRPEQALYYRLNGDDNPLHAEPAAALRAGFRGRSCMACAPSAWHSTRCCAGSPTTARSNWDICRCVSRLRCFPARPCVPRCGATARSALASSSAMWWCWTTAG